MKFPRKHGVMMNFLSSMLRDEVRIIRHPLCDALTEAEWLVNMLLYLTASYKRFIMN